MAVRPLTFRGIKPKDGHLTACEKPQRHIGTFGLAFRGSYS